MEVKIKNFMGVKSAHFEVRGVTMVYGDNGAGKTSTALGLKGVLSGDQKLFKEVTEKSTIQLVNDSAREAHIELNNGEGVITAEWPSNIIKQSGAFLKTSPASLGYDPTIETDKNKKAAFFQEILKSEPTEEDLEKAIGERCGKGFPAVLKVVRANGWDKASKHYADKAREQKGVFKDHAGINWGSAKGGTWVPDHWSHDLDGASISDLEAKKVQANENLQACIAATAVSEEKISELSEIVGNAPQIQAELSRLNSEVLEDQQSLKELGQKPLPIKLGEMGHKCPGCGTHLSFENGELKRTPPADNTQADVDQRNKLIKDFEKKEASLVKTIQEKQVRIAGLQAEQKKAEKAEIELAELNTNAQASTIGTSEQSQAEEDLRIATANLEAVQKKNKVKTTHDTIEYYLEISKTLAQDGLRKKILAKKIDAFNADLAKVFPEYKIKVDEKLDFFFGKRPLSFCSMSEMWRVSVAVRAIACKRLGDEFMIVDAVDILSNHRKSVLLKNLLKLKMKILMLCTVQTKSDAKVLPEKIGNTYILKEGVMEVLENE